MNELPEGYIAVPASAWQELVQYELKCQELAAQVETLKQPLQVMVDLMASGDEPGENSEWYKSANAALAATPAQCLRQVQADAGRVGYVSACLTHLDEPMEWIDKFANQHHTSILAGKE